MVLACDRTMKLEELINIACPDLREIVFHSDGRVIAKTGGRAKYPNRLYSSNRAGNHIDWSEKVIQVLQKLINQNHENLDNDKV